jgi:hypothetical protein
MSSAPHTPIRSPKKFVKSSPVGKGNQYFLPNKRDQYHKFGYKKDFRLGSLNEETFLQFLNPPSLPLAIKPFDRDIDMTSFLSKANEVSLYIKKEREHYLFLYLAFLADMIFHFS